MRARMIVGALGGAIVAFAPARGQAAGVSVQGIAFDSLRSAPLEGAFIRMAGAGGARTTMSDARGAFAFDSVSPGAYTFSMLHASPLDEIRRLTTLGVLDAG
jgi:hypothetical protein